MKQPATDILDTCKNNPVVFSGVAVSKLIKKTSYIFLTKFFMIFVLFITTSFMPGGNRLNGSMTVVIDAGHGGHDPGCIGKKSKEKDVALGIALKLGKRIEDGFSDVKVIYTRKTDLFVELHERADIANNAKADLFICIHANSACTFDKKKKKEICNPQIIGVESWVMGLHKSEENLEVSKRENEVILLEKDYTRQYGGFDPNSPEANIIFSYYQNTHLDQSLKMASFVQQEMKATSRPVRGVKQAGFLVLYKTTMPSILIETGFLSNAEEEKYLTSEKGQEQLAQSICNAFRSYKNSFQTVRNEPEQKQEPDTPETKKIEKQESVKPVNEAPKETQAKPQVEEDKQENKLGSNDVLQFSVQFYASPKPIPDNSKIYDSFDDVREEFANGLYKYSTGLFANKKDAEKLQLKIRQMGYADAFIIALLNNKRISIKTANEMLSK